MKISGKTLRSIIPHYHSFSQGIGKDIFQPIDRKDKSNVVYGVVAGDTLIRESYHTCFGKLKEFRDHYGYVGPEAILIQLQTEMFDERLNPDLYYEWLFNYSPWRGVFITKNLSSLYKKRVIVIDTDQNADLMVGGAIASRHPWESWVGWSGTIRNSILLWQRLVEDGNDPDTSFVFANQMGCSSMGGKYYVMNTSLGHQSISSNCEIYPLIHANFVEHKVLLNSSYKELLGYNAPSVAWNSNRIKELRLDDFIRTWLRGGEKDVINPFSVESETESFELDKILSIFKEAMPAYREAIKEI